MRRQYYLDQTIGGQHSPAASLARVSRAVAHAALLPLGLAEGDTLARPALALLNAVSPVSHVLRLGARGAYT